MKTFRAYLMILIMLLISAQVLFAGGKKETSLETESQVVVTEKKAPANSSTSKVLAPFWSIDLNGQEVSEEIFAPYDITMINVWGTYCNPCISEMPGLGILSKEYKDKGVQIIGIVVDVYHSDEKVFMEKLATARDIIAYTQADYRHILQSKDLIDLYLKNVQVIPTTFFVDSKGAIIGKEYLSSRSEEAWRKIIDEMIIEYVK